MKCRRRSQTMVSSFVRKVISWWRIVATGAIAATLLLAGCFGPVTNSSPAWLPDGSKIAFIDSTGGRGAKPGIRVMDDDGSNQTRLINGGTYGYLA